MISFTGNLKRGEYFRQLFFLYALYALVASLLVALARFLTNLNVIRMIAIAALVAFSVLWLIAILGIIVRRAHDTRNFYHSLSVGLLFPGIGMIMLGFMPSAHNIPDESH